MEDGGDRLEAPRDASCLYVASEKGCWVSIHDPSSLKALSRHVVFKADGVDTMSCLAVSPEGHWVAAASSDGEIKIFRAPEMKLESTLDVGRTPIQVELTENAALLGVVVDGRPGRLKLFRRR